MKDYAIALLALALVCSISADPAQAQRARTFVASYGNDANPCTFGSPCKTFQQAVNVVAAGGEVTAIDSAGFGPITISQAVTITSPDGVEAGIIPVAGGNAITINAGANDAIVLRGLTLNGSGTAYNGIAFNSGGSLTVINCLAQNFIYDGSHATTGNGILIQPTSGTVRFNITNSVVTSNAQAGISYRPHNTPNANGVVDNVTAVGNQYGISVNTTPSPGGQTNVAILNSVLSNNGVDGLFASGGSGQTQVVSVDHVSIVGNGSIGIDAETTSYVILGRSVITGNGIGVQNNTPNTFYTYQDNRISGNNTTDISSPLNPSLPLQ